MRCTIDEDFVDNPVLFAVGLASSISFVTLVLGLLFVFNRYKKLKIRYSRLGDNDPGEIELRSHT